MSAAIRLRFTVADQDSARQLVRASLPEVLGEALLLSGGEPMEATRLTEQTFHWLEGEVRGGRQTVTLGRLLLVLRHHFLEELHPAGRRRRRARAALQAVERTRQVVADRRFADAGQLVSRLPRLARAVVVLRRVDRMLVPDVAAALRLPEPAVLDIDQLVVEALEPVGGSQALRAVMPSGPPPLALVGRVLAPLVDALTPVYAVPLAVVGPAPRDEGDAAPARVEPAPRRAVGFVVVLAIVGALAVVTASRQVVSRPPPPEPPAARLPCITLPTPSPSPSLVSVTFPPVSLQPPSACRAP